MRDKGRNVKKPDQIKEAYNNRTIVNRISYSIFERSVINSEIGQANDTVFEIIFKERPQSDETTMISVLDDIYLALQDIVQYIDFIV